MSTIVGLSNKEITAISDACSMLHTLHRLTANNRQQEVSDTLAEILKRASPRWGDASDTRDGQILLDMLQSILPPEEEE